MFQIILNNAVNWYFWYICFKQSCHWPLKRWLMSGNSHTWIKMLYTVMKDGWMIIKLSFFILERGWSFCGVRDRRREGDKTDCYNGPLLLLSTIPSSRPHLVLLLHGRKGVFNQKSPWALLVRASWVWLQLTPTFTQASAYLFHNAHDFRSTTWLLPLIYTDVSCSEKSLIDGSVKGQYVTLLIKKYLE